MVQKLQYNRLEMHSWLWSYLCEPIWWNTSRKWILCFCNYRVYILSKFRKDSSKQWNTSQLYFQNKQGKLFCFQFKPIPNYDPEPRPHWDSFWKHDPIGKVYLNETTICDTDSNCTARHFCLMQMRRLQNHFTNSATKILLQELDVPKSQYAKAQVQG